MIVKRVEGLNETIFDFKMYTIREFLSSEEQLLFDHKTTLFLLGDYDYRDEKLIIKIIGTTSNSKTLKDSIMQNEASHILIKDNILLLESNSVSENLVLKHKPSEIWFIGEKNKVFYRLA